MELAKEFLIEMESLLGEEFPAFHAGYDRSAYRGIRLNPLKCSKETLGKALPFPLKNTPFSPLSYYAPAESKLGGYAAHHAGMFYAQEPSAASAVTLLAPCPGDKILDLCAAPGGKSTQIASLTGDTGLLVANEIVRSRASVLASNLERMGIRNAVVTSCRPDRLEDNFAGYFDKILVDAPCSGEGMFRHDPTAVAEWTPASPDACAARQAEILDSAAKMLRPGGTMVYSTCTFSSVENEGSMDAFLKRHPDFEALPVKVPFGRPAWNGNAVRIWPMDGGEGHFAALLRRKDDTAIDSSSEGKLPQIERNLLTDAMALWKDCFISELEGNFYHPKQSDTIYVVPEGLPSFEGIPVVRYGYEFAKIVGNRLEPCHGAFLCRKAEDCRSFVDFAAGDATLAAYLRGEEIPCAPSLKGYTAVCVCGVPLGFGKAGSTRLKNKYPKGLRNHK